MKGAHNARIAHRDILVKLAFVLQNGDADAPFIKALNSLMI